MPRKSLMRILYHHRTRGRGAEGVHIRSITDALRARGHEVDILSFPGADPEVQAADTAPLTRTMGAHGPWRWLSDLSNHVPEWGHSYPSPRQPYQSKPLSSRNRLVTALPTCRPLPLP